MRVYCLGYLAEYIAKCWLDLVSDHFPEEIFTFLKNRIGEYEEEHWFWLVELEGGGLDLAVRYELAYRVMSDAEQQFNYAFSCPTQLPCGDYTSVRHMKLHYSDQCWPNVIYLNRSRGHHFQKFDIKAKCNEKYLDKRVYIRTGYWTSQGLTTKYLGVFRKNQATVIGSIHNRTIFLHLLNLLYHPRAVLVLEEGRGEFGRLKSLIGQVGMTECFRHVLANTPVRINDSYVDVGYERFKSRPVDTLELVRENLRALGLECYI